MFASMWLIPLDLGSRIYVSRNSGSFYRPLAEAILYTIVDGKVYRPRRKVAQYCRAKTTVEPADAVVLEDILDCGWETR